MAELNKGGHVPPTISGIINHPLSDNFTAPPASTAKELVNWMLALQKRTYGEVTGIPLKGLQRNMKTLMQVYGIPLVQRGIAMALGVSDHPFSTALVEKMCIDIKEQRHDND